MVTEVDCHQIQFKLGPAYGLYMMTRHMYGAEFKAGPGGTSERRKALVTGLKSISSHLKKTVKVCTVNYTAVCRLNEDNSLRTRTLFRTSLTPRSKGTS